MRIGEAKSGSVLLFEASLMRPSSKTCFSVQWTFSAHPFSLPFSLLSFTSSSLLETSIFSPSFPSSWVKTFTVVELFFLLALSFSFSDLMVFGFPPIWRHSSCREICLNQARFPSLRRTFLTFTKSTFDALLCRGYFIKSDSWSSRKGIANNIIFGHHFCRATFSLNSQFSSLWYES